VFETDAGARVTYFDARRFGYMDLIPTEGLSDSRWFKGLGPEPLGAEFDAAYLARAFAGRRQAVKSVLLDQRTIAGLGNIYVSEALHRAGIAPDRPAGSLKPAKLTQRNADCSAPSHRRARREQALMRATLRVEGEGGAQRRFELSRRVRAS